MDYQLIALIAIMAGTVLLVVKQRLWWGPGGSVSPYHQVFSSGAAGLLFFVAGVIGWDLKYSRGWFQGTRWVDRPIWWEIALGAALLLVAFALARRVPERPMSR